MKRRFQTSVKDKIVQCNNSGKVQVQLIIVSQSSDIQTPTKLEICFRQTNYRTHLIL